MNGLKVEKVNFNSMCNKQISIFENKEYKLNIKNMEKPALLRDLPFDKVYHAARKEASRKKPAFFIHKYFARRITLNFRMMLLGVLLPYECDIYEHLYDSFDNTNLEEFTIIDPFMGGGTTLFEASRLNTKVIGSDLQPLSKFVSKALIESMDVEKVLYGKRELEKKIKSEIQQYYKTECPECHKEADIMYTFHVKKAQLKHSKKEVKLFTSFVLAQKKGIFTLVCPVCGEVFEHDFKNNGNAKCPTCSNIIKNPKDGYVKQGKYFSDDYKNGISLTDFDSSSGYPFKTDLIAMEYHCPHCNSHGYKKTEIKDIELYEKACDVYDEIKDSLPIPQQDIPIGYNTNQIRNHGYTMFKELFNKRQLLCLGLLLDSINEIEDKEIQFWMQLAFSGMLEMNNMFCRYQSNAFKISNIFFNHAYVPITMPVENNVWGTKLGTGNFEKTLNKIIRGKKFCNEIYDISTIDKNGKKETKKMPSYEIVSEHSVDNYNDLKVGNPLLLCKDSSNLKEIPDESVNLVLTDPPYGSNLMYSELIDFFHVWNKMSTLSSELGFIDEVSPKNKEIIVNEVRNKTQQDYEMGLTSVFKEMNRILKHNGFLIFSFHDKNLDSWVSVINSIYKSGFYLVKSYPLHSETRTGAHTSNKNSIALDIMLICKKKNSNENANSVKYDSKYIIKETFCKTEEFVTRLQNINAEITIPDIENIYISQFFCKLTECLINYNEFEEAILEDLKESISEIDKYFNKYNIKHKRNGWWSELYKELWEI